MDGGKSNFCVATGTVTVNETLMSPDKERLDNEAKKRRCQRRQRFMYSLNPGRIFAPPESTTRGTNPYGCHLPLFKRVRKKCGGNRCTVKLVWRNREGQLDTESILQRLPASMACRAYTPGANMSCDGSQQDYVTSSCLVHVRLVWTSSSWVSANATGITSTKPL